MQLADFFPERGPEVLIPLAQAYERLFPQLPLTQWRRHGTWIEYWRGDARLALAPHQCYSSLYFKDHEVTQLYREIGGSCRTGAVTITIPHKGDWDPTPIRYVIDKVLSSSKPKS